MKRVDLLRKSLQPGHVYRRADLLQWSNAVDRHLQELMEMGELEKLSGGLYYKPRHSVFGTAPASEYMLVHSFLKDDHFLITSPSDYNTLEVGTTQLYNERRVYNQKRHGYFTLGKKTFRFIRKFNIPRQLSKEFLLVDLVNNLKHLEEDPAVILSNVRRKTSELNQCLLKQLVKEYGTVGTQKQLAYLFRD